MAANSVSIRLLVPLPLVVDGGLTRWRIFLHYYGKGHKHASVIGDCLSVHCESVCFGYGRADDVERRLCGSGLLVERGSLAHCILSKLVREERAEVVRNEDLQERHLRR